MITTVLAFLVTLGVLLLGQSPGRVVLAEVGRGAVAVCVADPDLEPPAGHASSPVSSASGSSPSASTP